MNPRLRRVIGLISAIGAAWLTNKRQKSHSSGTVAQRPTAGSTTTNSSSKTGDLSVAEIRELVISYEPEVDGDPDPGEVVWAWVPYVENDGRGKDRPVLIVARIDAHSVAGCALSTKPHRGYIPVGSGQWDTEGRDSYLNPERVLRMTTEGMRREGHVLTRESFAAVTQQLTRLHGFSR